MVKDQIGAVCINMGYEDDLVGLSISEFLRQEGIQSIEALQSREKLNLIQVLEERDLFQIRGMVERVADLLDVSRTTIYNYRSNLKDGATSPQPILEKEERDIRIDV